MRMPAISQPMAAGTCSPMEKASRAKKLLSKTDFAFR